MASNSFKASSTQENVFGKPATSGTSVFGAGSSQQGLFTGSSITSQDGSSSPIFKSVFSTGTSDATSVFGASTFGQSHKNLFAMKDNATKQPSFSSGQTPTTFRSVFGSGISENKGSTSSNPPVFGESTSFTTVKAPVSSSTQLASQNLFTNPTTNISGTKFVFGGKSSTTTTNVFGDIKPVMSSDSTHLFRAPSSVKSNVAVREKKHSDVFSRLGCEKEDNSDNIKGIFGKPAENKTRLFGKEQQKDEKDNSQLSSKRTIFSRQVTDESSKTYNRGLFGKALSDVTGGEKPVKRLVTMAAPSGEDGRQSRATLLQEGSTSSFKSQRIPRRLSSEQLSSKTALVAKNIQPQYCTTSYLKTHFEKFGKIKRVYTNPEKRQATIHFETHEDAANAKTMGRTLRPGRPPIQMFWSNYSPGGKASSRRSSLEKRSELSDELASMAGTDDIDNARIKTLQRPEEIKFKAKTEEVKGQQTTSAFAKPSAGTLIASKPVRQERGVGIKSLGNTVAKTTSERLDILSQYDKVIRQGHKKQTDLKKARIFVGICPDMCPEKERYLREDRRRVHVYEMVPESENIPGQNPKIDHTRAVKEYSRSSADQEEPLPHELRPGPVLDLTMSYLLTNIIDYYGGDGRWSDWYDFHWNRMRGIRKDITQQNICDLTSAGLVEKCARFHIFCSERLCEEDMMTFDEKINNENLTKCLQTLREIYYDLLTNKNITCPNEAEFRAYMVLMNLNEADILREVQTLQDDIRNTDYIKFVLQVHSALNSNNYVKFFKLTKKASFLMACIMHRYFNQIRSKALLIILRAFTVGQKSVNIPVADLVRQLAFESEDEATAFCIHHGLNVNEGLVNFDRNSFIEPESAFEARRAINLIEEKQVVSIGEVVNGGMMPPYSIHQPQSSFDANGRFCVPVVHEQDIISGSDANLAEQTQSEATTSYVALQSTIDRPHQPPAPKGIPDDLVKSNLKALFLEVIDEMCKEEATNLMSAIRIYMGNTNLLLDEVTEEVVDSSLRDIANEILSELKMAEREKKAREAAILAARKDRVAETILQEVLNEVTEVPAKELAEQEYRDAQEILKQQCIERCSSYVYERLLEDEVHSEIRNVANEVFDADVIQRLELLQECQKSVELVRTANFMKKWRNAYLKKMRLKRSMYNFPPVPNLSASGEILECLLPDRENYEISNNMMSISKGAKVLVNSSGDLQRERKLLSCALSAQYYLNQIQNKKGWAPLDLVNIVQQHFARASSTEYTCNDSDIFWKLVLSLPDSELNHESDTTLLCDWIKAKFQRGLTKRLSYDNLKTEVLSSYSKTSLSRKQVSICTRTLEGHLSDNDVDIIEQSHLLLGTSAILFVLPPSNFKEYETEDYWLECQLRLARLLQAKPVTPALPVVIVTWDCPEEPLQIFAESLKAPTRLNLNTFLREEISSYEVLFFGECLTRKEASYLLKESVCWLAENSPAFPDLLSKPVMDFVEDQLAEHFFSPVYQDLASRQKAGLLHQDPLVLIDLYNSIINHMSSTARSKFLQQLSWPIPELTSTKTADLPPPTWNSAENFNFLEEVFASIVLPAFEHDEIDSESWEDAIHDIWSFVDTVAGDRHSTPELYSRIRLLLDKANSNFESACLLTYESTECKPCYVNVPWTDIVVACIHFLLSTLDGTRLQDEKSELIIFYKQKELDCFTLPTSWRQAVNADTEQGVTLDDTIVRSVKRKQEMSPLSSSSKLFRIEQLPSFIDLQPTSSQRIEADDAAYKLTSQIAEAKRESDMFEELLQNIIDEGDISMFDKNAIGKSSSISSRVSLELGSATKQKFERSRQKPKRSSYPFRSAELMGYDPIHNSSYSSVSFGFPESRQGQHNKVSCRISDEAVSDEEISSTFIDETGDLSETISQFQRDVLSTKTGDRLFEMRLTALMHDKP